MKRLLSVLGVLVSLAVLTMACNLMNQAANANAPAATTDASIEATTGLPTATPNINTNGLLPSGTLILNQLNNSIAQPPNTPGQTIALAAERVGRRVSPDGHYGVRFKSNNNLNDLLLIDFTVANDAGKAIPQGTGLSSPGITWKPDSSGFTFYDFPSTPKPTTLRYYDIASGQTSPIGPAQTSQIISSFDYSPDGKMLAYGLGNANSEGIGGPDSKLFILDTTNNQSTALPAGMYGFTRWLADSKSFLVRPANKGVNQLYLLSLASISTPKLLTPANTTDQWVTVSPDGKHLAVSSSAVGPAQVANIFIMNPDGSNRKAITHFTGADQTISSLIWGYDGIYYSLESADNKATTWRVNLDGSNATQIAQGTLEDIVGLP